MKKQLRSKYGFLILIGVVLLLFAYTSTFANNGRGNGKGNGGSNGNNQGTVFQTKIEDETIRTVTPEAVLIGDSFDLTYDLSLNNILDFESGPNINSYKYVEWAVKVEETIPEGLTVVVPPSNVHNLKFDSGTRLLTGTINIICGKKNSALTSCNEYKNAAFSDFITVKLIADKKGSYTFTNGRYAYSLEADHSGNGNGAQKHDRSFTDEGSGFTKTTVMVEELNINVPTGTTMYLGNSKTIEAKLSTVNAAIPPNAKLTWEIDKASFVSQTNSTNQSVTLKALDVGEANVKAVYEYANGQKVKSNDMKVVVKLPDLSLTTNDQELWVYKNEAGTLVKQQALLTLEQLVENKQALNNPLDVVWSVDATALSIASSQNTTATVQAEHGSNGNVAIAAKLKDYLGQTKTSLINVKEYPQRVSTPNVVLYMSDSPYSYPVKFWPETANVTGYGLTVLEGADVLKAEDGVLQLIKPGIAKVGLVTQDVSASFSNGDGPDVISQTFYVRVKAGTDPNPGIKDPSGDFY
ncbi:hypothetical protein EVJ27_10295 [Exiguobacterium sp. SH3S2]|uniref:hypothetical protein n=1 Tax=unclassified Exiguobacterium TaxID=2644629 RepID=UPI00103FC47A|nr:MULTISPECIES: hypothetical protein [unclassified Exiguobacterium]TCI43349.1 hypothetical protein EVJ28_10315 [Exiguobacterium sp. SH3S3]TCI59195.1 hypothetical protein EVJ27_10295 [Exiguobacterium sp. SH3S2]